MKNSFLLSCILLINCKENLDLKRNSKSEISKMKSEIKYGRKFFNYDQVDHYHIDKEADSVKKLFENRNNSKINTLKNGVITGEIPDNINDQNFLSYLNEIGYLKTKIAPSKFEKLNKIFIEKSEEETETSACIPIYRDILIFKKDKKVVGMIKICFSCHQSRIFGTNAKTENFGSNTDFTQLENILKVSK